MITGKPKCQPPPPRSAPGSLGRARRPEFPNRPGLAVPPYAGRPCTPPGPNSRRRERIGVSTVCGTVGTSTNCSTTDGSRTRARIGISSRMILGTSITCSATGKNLEESSSARVPRSSAEVRRVFIHDVKEVEGVGQQEQQGDMRDDEKGDEVKGEVEEIRSNAHRAHET